MKGLQVPVCFFKLYSDLFEEHIRFFSSVTGLSVALKLPLD